MPDTTSSPPRRLDPRHLRADLGASLVVFLVAVPLSLGIALASNAPIMAGLIAAVVGGVVAGILGGSPLQVSGPAAGLTVIVAGLVDQFGWQVTCLITVGAGLLQVLFGLTRLSRFTQAIPPAITHGMLAGIGITIALAQMHIVLGGESQTAALDNILQFPQQVANLHGHAFVVGLVAIAIMLAWPRIPGPQKAVPGALVAVGAATALALLWPDVTRVDLPGNLIESIALPVLPESGLWVGVLGGMLTVALVASVESLLSAVATDRMAQERDGDGVRTDADRELMGQGAGNAVSGLLGGLPITGVIVRSSANVRAGAKTRLSTILHGCWIALFGIVLISVIEMIPLAGLSGLLVVVGLALVKPADIRTARSHGELALYVVTTLGVVFLNLLEGVALGLVLAAVLMIWRAARARVRVEEPDRTTPRRVVVEGTLSFLSVPALSRVLQAVPEGEPVRVDLVVDYLDHTAFDHIQGWSRRHRATGGFVEVVEPEQAKARQDAPHGRFATWSQWRAENLAGGARMRAGLLAYQQNTAERVRPTMEGLAAGQNPSGLLLTCADSRVLPSMITQSGPGDLFTVQNVGNFVSGTSTLAAVQYAEEVLRVPLIAVCGHSGCGAMNAVLGGDRPRGALDDWLRNGEPVAQAWVEGHPAGRAAQRDGFGQADSLAMVNVALQLDRLRDMGVRAELMGLFYDIKSAGVLVYDARTRVFHSHERAFAQLPAALR
ncbi:bifunctional SulP family inorganic anion transporter/carbonic anhydrase [Pseudonocardia sp. WMMC193]|uniref:SulP family inorganic anion transporter n=1 Tax=Pseudonocardia sp. WMMC193 TaxID=2911965 RepID=UPI001F2F8088|nr:bifunctional SulP family inorganic anion transporter/carbonic anhydrase [Pseudonocardia sp. WMMC193]MCF7548403.1 bifunctional SulP family inorganic anion transporter/carbonic anhydrase [Pseudonocardia sp. WMMC193]